MADLPTRVDYFEIGAAEVLARSEARPPGQRLSPEEVYTEGSDINLLINGASAMAEEVTRHIALRTRALFLDSAEGDDLRRLISDRFSPDVTPKEATPAVARVEISRAAGPMAAVTIARGTRVRTSDSVEFLTQSIATLGAGSGGPVTVEVEAAEAGTVGNVGAGTITEFVDPPPDSNLAITNPERAAGGDDSETDARLRERARDFFRAARRGTIPAIEFGALSVAGIRQATAVEEIDANGDPTGRVQLFIADANGQGNASLVAAVRSALSEFRAGGIPVDIFASTPLFVPIRYRLRFEAGVDSTEAFESIRLVTIARVNALRPNATLPVSLLFECARSVPGVVVLSDAIQEPVGDLVPSPGEVIRTRADLVTAE